MNTVYIHKAVRLTVEPFVPLLGSDSSNYLMECHSQDKKRHFHPPQLYIVFCANDQLLADLINMINIP